MNLYQQMITFMYVADLKSFSQAADKLAITPTAVSKQIKNLEEHMGEQLLERSTRAVSLTAIGREFYNYCERIHDDMLSAEHFIGDQKKEPQGTLHILSSGFFFPNLLDHLKRFHDLYPKLNLHLEINERIPDFSKEAIDIMVGFSQLPSIPEHLRYKKLFDCQYNLVAAPSYLNKVGIPHDLNDLKKLQLINHTLRQPNNQITFKNGKQITMQKPCLIMDNFLALIQACCEGFGVFQCNDLFTKKLINEGKLIQILPRYAMPMASICIFYRFSQFELLKVRSMVDFLSAIKYDTL